MAVVARNSTLMCLKDQLLVRKTGDEKWRHAVVEGIPPGNALWVLNPGRSTKLVDSSADTKNLDGIRLPKSVPVDSVATADRSVHSVFSVQVSWRPLLRRWILMLVRGSTSLHVDRTRGRRCRTGLEGYKPTRSRPRSEENLMRRTGESTLVDVGDARIQSIKEA